jgi:class 3 adenylate cyclase
LPFAYGLGAFDAVEAADVLGGKVDAQRLRGKYVLVGSSAVGLSDYVNTPLQALTPGVLVHAQALAQLLDHGAPSPPGWSRFANLAGALLGVLGMGLLWRRYMLAAWAWACVLLLAWPALALAGLAQGLALQVLFVPAVCWGCLLAVSALELKLLRDVKQRALTTLSHYVAQPVLEQLFALGLANSLKPQLREITVLVVDMRNYTGLTDKMALDEIAGLMRDVMELITQPVLNYQGTLVHYTGDGLIAFWGAPLPRPDHADMALRCAGALQASLRSWNMARAQRGEEEIGMRIGIESGRALVGDLGSTSRSVFTAVGTCINTASRLQELGRDLKCDLVVGPAAAALVMGFVWIMFENAVPAKAVSWGMFAVCLFAGLTMVTNVPFYSFKDMHMKKSVPFATLVLVALGIAVVNIDPPTVLFGVFVAYGLSGYVIYVWRKAKGQPTSMISTSTDEPEERGLHQ